MIFYFTCPYITLMIKYTNATYHSLIEQILHQMIYCLKQDIKDDTYDIIYKIVDNYVSNNTIKQNKFVLKFYDTDVYDAIELYKEEYGDFEARNKEHFYALLAFYLIHISLMNNDYQSLEEKYNEFKEAHDNELSDVDTDEDDTNEDDTNEDDTDEDDTDEDDTDEDDTD